MHNRFGGKQLLLVVAGLVFIAGFIYLWDFQYQISSPLLTSIMAGIVIVIATVFGIDRLLAYRERLKWKQAKANVLMKISACLNGLLTNIRGLAAIDVSALDLPTAGELSSDEWSRRVNQNMMKFFESEKATITQAVRQRNQESWDNFFTASQSCIQELEKLLAMFPSISSEPELVEKNCPSTK